jgi:TRAP transporter TAXI family solute receptor
MRCLVAGLCLALSACTSTAEAPPKTYKLNLARTASNQLAEALKRLPNVKVEIVAEGGSSINSLIDLYNGKTDIAVPIADVAYLAYAGQLEEMPKPFDQLRGMSVADLNAIHLLVAPDTGVNSLKELAGLHVSLGPPGSSVALVSQSLLHAHGIRPANLRVEKIPNAEVLRQLARRQIDAAFTMFQPVNQPVATAMKSGVRLVDIEGSIVEELRTRYPYLKRTVIPAGTYPNQPHPVRTIGIEEELVYAVMAAYFATFPAVTPINLDRAPATPVPLHPGAARYYRQRELAQ